MPFDRNVPAAAGRRHRFTSSAVRIDFTGSDPHANNASGSAKAKGDAGALAAKDTAQADDPQLKPGSRTDIYRQFQVELDWDVDGAPQKIVLTPGEQPDLQTAPQPIDLTATPKGKRLVTPRGLFAKNGVVTYTLTVTPAGGGKPIVSTVDVVLKPDLPVSSRLALLLSDKAPLAAGTTDPLDDKRAVWTFVHPRLDLDAPEIALYFHGDKSFVSVDEFAGASRVPSWVRRSGEARGTLAAGIDLGFELMNYGNARPLVLLPECGVPYYTPKGYNPWSSTSAGRFSDKTALRALVEDCLDRLVAMPAFPALSSYLSKKPSLAQLKRLILISHSGGGIPLTSLALSELVDVAPTQLWAIESTYSFPNANYVDFIKRNKARVQAGQCRLVLAGLRGNTDTEPNLDNLVALIKMELGKPLTAQLFEEVVCGSDADVPNVQRAVQQKPVVVIRFDRGFATHGSSPNKLVPILFQALA